MSNQQGDISWQTLNQILTEWGGSSAELVEATPLHGGCINTTILLRAKHDVQAVLKISPHRVDRHYEDEAWQLAQLREAGLPVPEVYRVFLGSLEQPFSYILLEYLPGIDLTRARRECSAEQFDGLQSQMAEFVLQMHACTADEYGCLSRRDPRTTSSWPVFYRQDYAAIFQEVERQQLLPKKIFKQIARFDDRLERLLLHDDQPRLTHGDLWSNNMLAGPDENGNWRITAVLDPNCKFAHAEAELAYLELFNTATPAFFKTYQQQTKLPAEYHRVRKPIYQLFPLLDHLQLFGAQYADQVKQAVQRVANLV